MKRLIEGCRKNDRRAQKEIYDRMFGKMLALCRRYASSEDAMEIMNDGFLKVFKNIHQYQSTGSFEGWVNRIMVNTCLDHVRAVKNQPDFDSFGPNGKEEAMLGGFSEAYSNIGILELQEMIERLAPMSKAVFNMFAIDGYSHKEISVELNISENTSRWHLHEARLALQRELKKRNEFVK